MRANDELLLPVAVMDPNLQSESNLLIQNDFFQIIGLNGAFAQKSIEEFDGTYPESFYTTSRIEGSGGFGSTDKKI